MFNFGVGVATGASVDHVPIGLAGGIAVGLVVGALLDKRLST